MNNTIKQLNGDFEAMPDDELANESLNFVLGEIRKDAVEQYKAELLEWFKAIREDLQAIEFQYAQDFVDGQLCVVDIAIKHIEGEK